ncbi:MAG TPA: hypothetical protein VHJ38_00840 [Nitrososphaeraceae archaeon]|nr:hypothetical protein [Nitrososphaeraceae archaeon]
MIFTYSHGKIVISPLIFEGSAIEKNGYFPGDKFTAKYSANEPDFNKSTITTLSSIKSKTHYH